MIRVRPVLLAVLLAAAALPAAAQEPRAAERERFLDEAVVALPETLDPHRIFAPWWNPMFRLIYETPLACDPASTSLDLVPVLLAELPTLDESGTLLELTLRKEARFVDDPCFDGGRGRPIVAADLADVLRRHLDPATRSGYWAPYLAGRIAGLDALRAEAEDAGVLDWDEPLPGIEIVDDHRLRIRFQRPYPQFLALMATPWFAVIPREASRRYGSGLSSRPVGSGPYALDAEASGEDLLVFRARRDWWRRREIPQGNAGVRFHRVPELESRELRFENGELDVLDLAPARRAQYLTRLGRVSVRVRPRGARLLRTDALRLHYLSFDLENRILGKRAVRRALALALDREAWIRVHRGGAAVPAHHVVPPSLPIHAETRPWAQGRHDVEEARRLLAEAGHPKGVGVPELTVDFAYRGEEAEREARLLARDWARLGIAIQPRFQDLETFQRRVRDGAFEIASAAWYADYPDAENFFLTLSAASIPAADGPLDRPNHGGFRNDEYEALYRRSCRLLPGEARGALYARMIEIIQDEVPWIFLAHPVDEALLAPGLEGMASRNPHALDYSRVSIR